MTVQLQNNLMQALEAWGIDLARLADPRASLIRSGLLDSQALFNLSMWVEGQVGGFIDPSTFDVAQTWDSVESIVRFVQERAGSPSVHGAGDSRAPAFERSPTRERRARVERRHGRYRIVRSLPVLDRGVAALLAALWSPDASLNAAVFRWKYLDNPFAADPLIYLALRDGKPVAMRTFCGSAWEGGGARATTVYVADDFVVAEEDRNAGLFQRFTEAALDDLNARGQDYFLSLSALRVTRLQSLATGSRSAGAIATLRLVPSWVAATDRVSERMKAAPLLWRLSERVPAGAPARASFARLDAVGGHREDDLSVAITRNAEPEAMAAMVRGLPHDGRIRHMRDERYFRWRYRHPLHEYRFLEARRGRRLVGYVVVQRSLSTFANQRRVNVVDWACESTTVLATLLAAAMRHGRFAELVTWRMPGTDPLAEAFEQLGFAPTDMRQTSRGLPCVLVRSVREDGGSCEARLGQRALLDASSWDLRMAYTSYG